MAFLSSNNTYFFVISVSCLLICFGMEDVQAGGGMDNNGIGTKGYSMGNAITAIADDASAVYYNPAGLAFLDKNTWYAETYAWVNFTDFEYKANSISDKSDEKFINFGFFFSKAYEKWAVGFGGYVPYAGGGTKYDSFQGMPYDLEFIAGFFALTPAIAYRLSPEFSVGIGTSIYFGMMELDRFDPSILAQRKSEYDGIAGYGGHIGFYYEPVEKFSLGLVARSAVPIEMEGEEKVAGIKKDSEVDFTIPYYFTLGLSYKPDKDFTFGVSSSYMLWGDTDRITFTTEGIKNRIQTYYKNSFLLGAGIEYRIADETALWAGLKFVQGATEKKGLNPASNDVDLLVPSIGIAYQITKTVEAALTVIYAIGFEEEVDSQKYDADFLNIQFGVRVKR